MTLELVNRIIAGTPLWVFALFAYVIWQGYRRLTPQVTAIHRVAIVPALFIAWGLHGLFSRPIGPEQVAAVWLPSAALGIVLGALTSPRRLQVDRWRGLVLQPGSVLPLLRLLLIFGAHYGLNIAMALRPDARHALILCDIAVSGLSAGYFIGWIAAFLRTSGRAPEVDLSAFGLAPETAR